MIRSVVSLTLLLLSAFWFFSCCPEDPFVPTRPPVPVDPSKQALLRIVIADPNIDRLNITLGGENIFPNALALGFFEYPEDVYEAHFWRVDTGTNELAFALPGQEPLASTSVTLQKGTYHTAYFYSDGGEHKILLTTDDPTNKPDNGYVRYRIVNMAVGAPSASVQFANDPPVVENLAYGDTSETLERTAGFINGGMKVTETQSEKVIFQVSGILLSGGTVITLVIAGKLRPLGDERLVFLGIFQDSFFDEEMNLYGGLPLPFELLALKFTNLVSSGDSALDLTLYDPRFGGEFPDNFRRNFPGQPGQKDAVLNVAPLETDSPDSQRGYFFLSTFLYNKLPYRIEVTNPSEVGGTGPQTVLIPRVEFPIQADRRYTVIAYGPFAVRQASAVTMFDRVPPPPSGQTGLRFFHGDYLDHRSEQLRIRVNGKLSPPMSYGKAPDPMNETFTASASSSLSVDLLDESDSVVHTENGINLKEGTTYTLFLSRGPDGSNLLLTAVSEEVIPE